MGRTRRCIALVCLSLAFLVTTPAPRHADAATRAEINMASLINSARSARGIRTLRLSASLSDVARRHSYRMARANRVYHNRYLYRQVCCWHWLGEIVARGYTVRSIFRRFMRSDIHRGRILNRHFTRMGVGIVSARGYLWVTVVFWG